MKHKKFFFFLVLCFLIYFIYHTSYNDGINYLSIGDSLSLGVNSYGDMNYGYSDYIARYFERENQLKNYSKDFATPGARIEDFLYQLDTNQLITKDNKTLSFKKCLREADFITLSIGGNDLLSEISLSTIDVETLNEEEVIKIIDKVNSELDTLFQKLRKYATEEIVFLGYYNPLKKTSLNIERIFSYLQNHISKTCQKYDITYVDLYPIFKENNKYLPNPTNIHPSTEGYEAIANKIIRERKKKT